MEGNTLTAKCKESNPPQESQDFEVSILSLSDQNINLFLINLHKISKVKIVCRNFSIEIKKRCVSQSPT